MTLLRLSIIASLLLLNNGSFGQGCKTWNYAPPGTGTYASYYDPGGTGHITGNHFFDGFHGGSCSYSNTGGLGTPCDGYLSVGNTPSGSDTGVLLNPFYYHVLKYAQTGGSAGGRGVPISATARAGTAVEACLFGLCNFSVSINIEGTGVTVSSGTPIWEAEDNFNASCVAEWNGCPLILDVAGEGFQLTDALNGVMTDMIIPGRRLRFGWTKQGSHNAFLWLNNHLFTNSTPQPPSDNPNAFGALAVYDSNADGVIDDKDPVYKDLRLWIDANHDGVAQPDELFTLPSLGVYSIGLRYHQDKYVDEFGNHFNLRGRLRSAAGNVDRTIYDVWLTTN